MLGNWLAQIGAVTLMNLRNVRERLGSTLVALVGVAGVVTVVVGVLSINEGFRAVLQGAGADDVAIVLRGGATDEMTSGFSQTETRVIADAEQIARDGNRPDRVVGALRHRRRAAEVARARRRTCRCAASARTPPRPAARLRDHRRPHVHAGHVRGHRRPRRGVGVRGRRGRRDDARRHDGLDRRRALPRPRQRRRVGDLDRCAGAAGCLQPRHELSVGARAARRARRRCRRSRTR